MPVTFVNTAKTAEPIEMPFGLVTQVSPRNRVLDGRPDPGEWANFGAVRPTERCYESLLWCTQQKINNGISANDAANYIAPKWLASH